MNSNGDTNADIATVYGEEVHVPGLAGWLAEIDERGYAVIPDWIGPERVKRLGEDLRREVNPIDKTMVRAHNLLGKTRCVDDLVCDPRLLALAQGVLGDKIQVSVVAMFDLLPGAKAQGLHQDDGLWPLPRPHPPFVVNGVIAADDFTKENGATVLVPGSHKWHDQEVRQPPDVATVQVEMGAGSLLVWTGAMWHGGGANTTDQSRLAIAINFNLSYLRQQENQYIGVPREEVAKMPERLRRVLGYQHGMSFVGPGMVDLRDPLEMVDRVHFGYDVNDPDMPAIG
ncbi:MAG: phytanoyl-CoA dioxygenase family protein [Pseudomonadales bacterium]|nr:phytanoyl-CoA dioxygenase family protein [Pseudomonadales bacterium]